MKPILAEISVTASELEHNYPAILAEAEGGPIAVIHHDQPEAYLLPAELYENLLEQLEDQEDRKRVNERGNGPFVEVELSEL